MVKSKMRKVTIKLHPNSKVQDIFNKFLDNIKSVSVQNVLKIDFNNKSELDILKIETKNGFKLQDANALEGIEILSILKNYKNTYFCLVKITYNNIDMETLNFFNLDVIWDKPMIIKKDELVMSCVASEKNLNKFVKMMPDLGEVQSIVYKKSDYKGYSILSELTERQREIFLIAKRQGYYDYPRMINGQNLAKIAGCSKATLIEHLRIIEKKITDLLIDDIL
ncbi:hypothetical protein GF327_08120 [Candidatus Woesearchaeota archaeon]|nr:hypothetical protein [Candidatus Woesearchaeota archaeon]